MEMGIGQLGDACFKRKFRWLLTIDGVSGNQPINSLPPSKSSRPQISFKPFEIQHINETIYRPSKPDWKPLKLTLYDIKKREHPVFKWLKKQYNPASGVWNAPNLFIIANVQLMLYDGCGEVLETWVYENVWIEEIDFEDLDMASSDVVMCVLSLRYDRAYIQGEEVDIDFSVPFTGFNDFVPGHGPIFNKIDDSFISNRGREVV